MRTTLPALAAFLASASAILTGAPAFILQSNPIPSSDTIPSLTTRTARLIFEQRLNTPNVFLSDSVDVASREAVIAAINTFGRAPKLLFGGGIAEDAESVTMDPSQLVVLIEGVDEAQIKEATEGIKQLRAFEVAEAPSSMANSQLLKEHPAAGAGMGCELAEAVNPLSADCWKGTSSLVRFDAAKDSSVLPTLKKIIPTMTSLAVSGEMDSVIVFFPKSSTSKTSWLTAATELRRRQADEAVMTETTMSTSDNITTPFVSSDAASPNPSVPIFVLSKDVPDCFKTVDICTSGTNSCSGNGLCTDRWAGKSAEACYVCSCVKKNADGSSATTGFAGKACEKEDYSTPFALFVGFGTLIVGVLTFSINLLVSVGSEPLPGVIGAGVAKK